MRNSRDLNEVYHTKGLLKMLFSSYAVFQDVRSGRLFHSDSTEPEESSNGSSTSSSSNSMDATLAQDLRDSGIAESVSTQDDMDLSFNSLSFRQTSTESEVDSVFLTMSGDHDIHTDTRQSLKRHHSSDSDN